MQYHIKYIIVHLISLKFNSKFINKLVEILKINLFFKDSLHVDNY